MGEALNLMWDSLPKLLDGAFLTLELIILALVIGFILAVPVALMRTAKNPFFNIH